MKEEILKKFGLEGELPGAGTGSWFQGQGELLESFSPIDGRVLGRVRCAASNDYEQVVNQAVRAFEKWRQVPAPRRGEVVRQIGQAFRACKADLGALVSLEMGKIRAEGEGEVQEMIDMADYAVGLSRMLYGMTMQSERPGHRMYEQWHPLGPVGVITAFNFPVAVWAWNAMIALVAGDPVIWKPSSKVPLCALAALGIAWKVLKENDLPEGLLSCLIGKAETVGEALIRDPRIPLISATGSVPMGRQVGQAVKGRLGKTLLELGGNNAIIVTPNADLPLAVRAFVFGAVGTAGQRCTSTRRLIVHQNLFPALSEALIKAYRQIPIGNPLEAATLMGPLID
ncbi:MAG: aldehyde dehydrogenase family protein, partial [Deltaproteobacteria bacterium]|nr:aldehyde dehydrogenase family protein [Deltaproteobacteria bacterium]